jgi:predicted transcriptional regulator
MPVFKNYYNTNNINGDELRQAIAANASQDKKIYELFKVVGKMTKWDAYDLFQETYGPILEASVSRALGTLTKEGYIEKTEEQVPSKWGALNHIYKLN